MSGTETRSYNTNGTLTNYYLLNGTVYNAVYLSKLASSFYLSRVSTSTPGFHKIQHRSIRELPMNPFSYTYEKITEPKGIITGEYLSGGNRYGNRYEGCHYGYVGPNDTLAFGGSYPSVSAAAINALEAKTVTKVLLKMKDQKVNLAQAFAERKQTADLIAVTATRCAEAITSLKRGNYRGAARALGVAASRRGVTRFNKRYVRDQTGAVGTGWLELQYGWRPLLSDVYGSAELIAQKRISEIIDRAVASSTYSNEINTKELNPQGYWNWVRYLKGKVEYTIKYVVYFSSSSPAIHTLAQVGISNPELLAWELLPWSFVADWFIPIGNYLGSFDATNGLTFQKGTRTVFIKQSGDNDTWAMQGQPTSAATVFNGFQRSEKEYVKVTRESLTGFPSAKFPGFKNPLSFEHAANAIALLRQVAFKR
jgi:hypothetical protein